MDTTKARDFALTLNIVEVGELRLALNNALQHYEHLYHDGVITKAELIKRTDILKTYRRNLVLI